MSCLELLGLSVTDLIAAPLCNKQSRAYRFSHQNAANLPIPPRKSALLSLPPLRSIKALNRVPQAPQPNQGRTPMQDADHNLLYSHRRGHARSRQANFQRGGLNPAPNVPGTTKASEWNLPTMLAIGKVILFAIPSPAERTMKALLSVFAVLSLLVYAAHSAAEGEPPSNSDEDGSSKTPENDSQVLEGEALRNCLLEKTWSECGLVPFSFSELSAQIESEQGNNSDNGTSWRFLGPWAKTIPEYSTQ